MTIVIDNLLTPSYYESIYNIAKGHLSYQYMTKTSYDDPKEAPLVFDPLVKDFGQFSCSVQDSDRREKNNYGWVFEQLKPIFFTVKDSYPELGITGSARVKFNILLQQEKAEGFYNQPHIDVAHQTYTMIYYLNDCDGDTVIFNEMYSVDRTPIKLTIKEKVTPKKNRALIFESNRYHASSNPVKSENRFVMNWVFWK